MPCISLLVSYLMKKPNNAGKVNEFGKKTVSLKLYKTRYILLSCTKFNSFNQITTKIFLSARNFFRLHSWYPLFLYRICNLNNTYHNIWYHKIYIYYIYIYLYLYLYKDIYIYIWKSKKRKKIHILCFCLRNSKQNKYTKLNISNSIQYKHQERTFQTVTKFFSSYIQ